MVSNNSVIKAPVSTTDVGTVLLTSSHDVGTLCSSSNINMWAKYKPVDYNSVAPDRNGTWWKGTDGMCGISIPSLSGGLDNIYDQPWTYNPPDGGASAPYRLADFNGYNNKCTYFITGRLLNSLIDADYDTPIVYMGVWIILPTPTNNLLVTDCSLISSMRYAVKLDVSLPTGSRSYIITSENTLGDSRTLDTGLCLVKIDMSEFQGLDSTKFTVTLFLTTSSFPTMSTFPTVITCYSIPNYLSGDYTNRTTINYSQVSPGLQMTCVGLANNDISGMYYDEEHYMRTPYVVGNASNYLYWQLSVKNNTDRAITLNVNDLVWKGPNLDEEEVEDSYSRDLRLYNSSKSLVTSTIIPVTGTDSVTIYVRTRLFNYSISTINLYTEPVYGTWYGEYTNTSLNIHDRLVGRFESAIIGTN